MSNFKDIKIHNNSGRKVGYVGFDDDGTLRFHKTITGSKHMLRKPLAIALDSSIFAQLKLFGCEYIEVTDWETGFVYVATVEQFEEKSLEINRGYGLQLALPLQDWMKSNVSGGAA